MTARLSSAAMVVAQSIGAVQMLTNAAVNTLQQSSIA
jgi:hypothetical protein